MRSRFQFRAVTTATCTLITAAVCATQVQAQKSSQSDITGVVVSGGDVAPGAFKPSVPAVVPTIPTPSAVATVKTAIAQASSPATADAAAATTSASGTASAAAAPAALPAPVAAVLGCVGQCAPQVASLTAAIEGAGGVPTVNAQALTSSLNDLASSATMSPPQLAQAITSASTAFQQLIEKADVAYLSNPPKEIVAIHKLLVNLITAANAK